MKLVGISMVRNEADIVDLTLRHHLRLGCDLVLVVDNGSTDGTLAILRRLARRDSRITVTSDPGPYRQSEVMSDLAQTAHALGADWILPFDADEFWWCPPGTTLPAILAEADPGIGVFQVPVMNFVQRRTKVSASRRALLHMRMRARPVPPAQDAKALVTAGKIGFVEIEYSPKSIFRAAPALVVLTGNHGVEGAAGRTVVTDALACLHAPLRSRRALQNQVEHGRRVAEARSSPDLGWQSRRWLRLSENNGFDGAWLNDEWAANSYAEGALDVYGQRHPVEPDDRLRSAVRSLLLRHPVR